MHWRLEDSSIEECSLAFGRRKATFAGPGPQPTMLPWFQRSTHVRKAWVFTGLCPHETAGVSSAASETQKLQRRTAVRRKVAVEAFAAQRSVRLLIVSAFPTADSSGRLSSP